MLSFTVKRTQVVQHNTKGSKRHLSTNNKFLTGKHALVTGSTSGIGLEIATSLASQGASVVLNGFGDQKQIESVRQELSNKYNVKAGYHGANLAKLKEVEDLINYSRGFLGRIDILVNNAGIQHVSPVDKFPVEKWDDVLAINLSAPFHTIRLALPDMKKHNWGTPEMIILNYLNYLRPYYQRRQCSWLGGKH
jgi:3-hydroxybutyrate dehydrogenase